MFYELVIDAKMFSAAWKHPDWDRNSRPQIISVHGQGCEDHYRERVLARAIKEGLSEEVTFELSPEGCEGCNPQRFEERIF